MTAHPPIRLMDVYGATLPSLKFEPGVHVNYAETILPMKDGLPKLKDFPADLGGSGEQCLSDSSRPAARTGAGLGQAPVLGRIMMLRGLWLVVVPYLFDIIMIRHLIPAFEKALCGVRHIAALVVLPLECDHVLNRVECHCRDELHLAIEVPV